VQVDALDGYRLWSETYDSEPNPVVSLERRILRKRMDDLRHRTVLDVATGTGYWLAFARGQGARAFGLDLSPEMLRQAAAKPLVRERLILSDMHHLPFRAGAFDLTICSFALSYVSLAADVLREMARVARTVIVTDLHPEALRAGWRRGFRSAGVHYHIRHFAHDLHAMDECADRAGMRINWRIEASFGPAERDLFAAAGKLSAFAEASRVPALLSTCWGKR
jgi:malonyl-CoA O-methyltransferase